MRTLSTDVAIIGAGTAGLNARREVERAGKRWLLIEAGEYGTTCARTGCMPSKLLIAAADTARSARRASVFGLRIADDAIRVDGPAVLARVRRERDRFTRLTATATESLPEAFRLRGRARFTGPNELSIGDHTRVQANAIVIATGSVPIIPKELAPLGDAVLTTDTLFELSTLPESIAVFGTGAIGLELGQALSQLGVRVAFYNPFEEVGSFSDPVVKARFREHMSADLDLALGAQVVSVRADNGLITIQHREPQGRMRERAFSHVLAAVGRRPALEGLALERAGIALDDKGKPRFERDTMRCGDSAVFVAGDVDGDRPVLHEAVDDGRIAGENAARHPAVSAHRRRTALQIGFTHPQIAVVGLSYDKAKERDIAIGESSYEDQGRARVIGQNRGIVRVYAARESRVLIGAELFGPGVEHTAHLLAWAVQQELTLETLLCLPVYHPTLEEGVRSALQHLARELGMKAEDNADQGDCPGA